VLVDRAVREDVASSVSNGLNWIVSNRNKCKPVVYVTT